MRRRVQARWVGLADPLPSSPPPGLDLLIVKGLAGDAYELAALQTRLENWPTAGPLVIGVPRGAGPHPTWRWLYQGRYLEVPAGNRRQLYQALLQAVYCDQPGPWQADRATRRLALEHLLDLAAPLWLPLNPPRDARSLSWLLHQALVEPGLLEPELVRGQHALFRWRAGSPQRAEGRLFRELLLLLRTADSPLSLQDVLDWLALPPRGLRGRLAWLYLVAAVRCHGSNLRLGQGSGAGSPPSSSSLRAALRRPKGWRIAFRAAESHETAFLQALGEMFAGPGPGDPSLDPWDEARRDLLQWWQGLPGWTRRHLEGYSLNGMALVRICQKAPVTAARTLLREVLPHALRAAGLPREAEQGPLLERLQSARLELEGHLKGHQDLLATRLHALFTGLAASPGVSRQWLEQGCREWLAGMPCRQAQTEEFSPWALGLRTAILSQAPVEQRWFEELPLRLELPPVARWDADHSLVFLARVARARLELELWTVLRTLPLAPQVEQRQQQVARWIRETLQSVAVTAPRAERILFDLLEQLYAQETPT